MEQLSVIRALLPHLSIDDVRDVDPDAWWQPPTAIVGSTGVVAPTPELAAVVGRFLRTDSNATATEPAPVLAQWLRFYGPREAHRPAHALGIEQPLFEELMHDLSESDTVVIGTLIRGVEETQVCDAENLEHLLAMLRRAHRPVFEPVPPQRLIGLWAETSRMTMNRFDPEHLVSVLETLFGYPTPVQLWESDLIPARLREYYPAWLDGLFKESALTWFGSGSERIGFALADDLPLFFPSGPAQDSDGDDVQMTELMRILRKRQGAEFWELSDKLGLSSEDLTKLLWKAAWNGRITNDSFETIRKGALTRFTATPVSTGGSSTSSWPGQRRPSRSRQRWAATRPLSGRWFALGPVESGESSPESSCDPIAELEMDKERARIVLERYGIVFRELLQRELPALRWSRLFRALRMMELSGEVVAGGFVQEVPGIQFALPRALPVLGEDNPSGQVIWMNAADPASPCGLTIGKFYPNLPARVPSNHVVFRSNELVMVGRKNGAEITFLVDPTDPDVPRMLAPLRNMVSRRWNPKTRVAVESINKIDARESPYADALVRAGFRRDRRRLILSAGYR